ncbi:YqhG family protein [Rummeliibacillus stabekisii]|uniref:YqhG n=1 Tax=Rummeliibacillus stabekisii TaxID=241244 RepID=A0A143HBL1_9BACL|nr:YqhG family protein [Rummeliibacillus stabekisii]AMW98886.1 hypothetical protein ATY39_05120 [Rummeliibacillus stabekisii]
MYSSQVNEYLSRFFEETDCSIIERHPHYITAQLTIDMDKRIMNRPYYWKYVESTNGVPCPAQLTCITHPEEVLEDVKGEIVRFGSYRLNQIFRVAQQLGAYVQLYEAVDDNQGQIFLTPFLAVNYKVSYYCDQTKEMLFSFGLNLMTGEVIEQFHEQIQELSFVPERPNAAFPLQYIIKPLRGIERLDELLYNIIQGDDHNWAEKAKQKWVRDQRVLDYFYNDVEDKPECYEIEKKALEERYAAKIKCEIINGGIFYLK